MPSRGRGRKQAQKYSPGYKHFPGRRQPATSRHSYIVGWGWTDALWKGVTSAWLACWRWVWRLHVWPVLFATLLIFGQWLGLLQVLPASIFVPLRAGVILYWVLAAALWIVIAHSKRQRALFLQTRAEVRREMYPAGYILGGETTAIAPMMGDADFRDYEAGDFSIDIGGGGDGD